MAFRVSWPTRSAMVNRPAKSSGTQGGVVCYPDIANWVEHQHGRPFVLGNYEGYSVSGKKFYFFWKDPEVDSEKIIDSQKIIRFRK